MRKRSGETTTEIVKDISDEDLGQCVKEILEWHKTGILSEGKFRGITKKVEEILSLNTGDGLRLMESEMLMEAGRRWISMTNRSE